MKLAIVVDDLIQDGGQERLTLEVLSMYPDAKLFASVISKEWQEKLNTKKVSFNFSFMQKLPFIEKLNRYYFIFLFHILAFERFNFDEFDVVLSISARFSHHIKTSPKTLHICYMNSPGRMFWQPFAYFKYESFGFIHFLKKLSKTVLKLPLAYIRLLDYTAAQRVDYFIANSNEIRKRIEKYYKREVSCVIYPPVKFEDYKKQENNNGEYYLVITRLASWKRVDIAVSACEGLGLKLIVIGEGPDKKRLKKLSNGQTSFLGYVSDSGKLTLLQNAKALIQTQLEDFGIVPIEAMYFGSPVIAYGRGGVLETVIDNKTGIFFNEQTASSLSQALEKSNHLTFDKEACKVQAEKFSVKIFNDTLFNFMKTLYENNNN